MMSIASLLTSDIVIVSISPVIDMICLVLLSRVRIICGDIACSEKNIMMSEKIITISRLWKILPFFRSSDFRLAVALSVFSPAVMIPPRRPDVLYEAADSALLMLWNKTAK
jgi:hypothetical protein